MITKKEKTSTELASEFSALSLKIAFKKADVDIDMLTQNIEYNVVTEMFSNIDMDSYEPFISYSIRLACEISIATGRSFPLVVSDLYQKWSYDMGTVFKKAMEEIIIILKSC